MNSPGVEALVPRGKSDTATARAAVAAGYPAVAPILGQLLEWLKDPNWPVAHELAPFLASIGAPLATHLRVVLASDDQIWRRSVIVDVIGASRPLVMVFKDELISLARSPSEAERQEDVHEAAEIALRRLQE